jgi:hypothetical protein
VYNDPSWAPLLRLTRERTDRIVMRHIGGIDQTPDSLDELTIRETSFENGSRFERREIRTDGSALTSTQRRDPGTNTIWETEHLLKDADDLRAWIDLPENTFGGRLDTAGVLEAERALGEAGIVMLDTGDPLCAVASLFDMAEFTIVALTERALFRRALDKAARELYPRVEAIARALPGRLWRICGSEYAAPPYLPPELHREYLTEYDRPLVEAIHASGGYARIHAHGRLCDVLDNIAQTGCVAIDPLEPPPQGDMTLAEVRRRVGAQMTLFGNLEVSDIETLCLSDFAEKVQRALDEGTAGAGRGFVLMPSACPYGRTITPDTYANYEAMVEMVEG